MCQVCPEAANVLLKTWRCSCVGACFDDEPKGQEESRLKKHSWQFNSKRQQEKDPKNTCLFEFSQMNYSTHVPVMEKPPTNYRLPSAPDESPCPPTLVEPDELDRHSTTSADDVRVHLMAGAAAGIMEHCVMYPVDSVKVRFYRSLFCFPYIWPS